MARPSYKSGFATHSNSVRPNLWRRAYGSWCPSLGASGDTVRDWSGKNRHGTLTNTDISTVWRPDGLLLDGSDDYLDTAIDIDTFDWVNGPWTSSVWAKTTTTTFKQTAMGWGSGDVTPFSFWSVYRHNTTGTIDFRTYPGGTFTGSTVLPINTWAMLTLRYSSPTDAELYVDAKLVASSATATIGTRSAGYPYTFGDSHLNAQHAEWNGYLDDGKLFDRSLDPSEIRQLYELGPAGTFAPARRSRARVAAAAAAANYRTLLGVGT